MWGVLLIPITYVIVMLIIIIIVSSKAKRKQINVRKSFRDSSSIVIKNDKPEEKVCKIDKQEKIKQEILSVSKYVEYLKNKEKLDVLCAFCNTKFKRVFPSYLDYVFSPYDAWEILSETEPVRIMFRCNVPDDINDTIYTKALKNMNSIIIRKEEDEVRHDFLVGRAIRKIIISIIENDSFVPKSEYEKSAWQKYGQMLKELKKFANSIICSDELLQVVENNTQEQWFFCFAICFIWYALIIENFKDEKFIKNKSWLEINIDKPETMDNREFIFRIIKDIFDREQQIENEEFLLQDVLYFVFYVFSKYEKGLTLAKFKCQYAEMILCETKNRIKKIKAKDYIETLKNQKHIEKKTYNISQIDAMDGQEFENFVTELFSLLGYTTSHTKLSGDQGVDVIAEGKGRKIAIQAKHYNQPVGNHAIMEVVAGSKIYNANLCYVVTNNYFTKSAIALANANNVILWDREKLIEKISEV